MTRKINALEVKFNSWSITHEIEGDTEDSKKIELKTDINKGDIEFNINKKESEKIFKNDDNLNNEIIDGRIKELNKKIKNLESISKEMAQRLVVNNNHNENFIESSEEKIKQMNTNFKNLENLINQKDKLINNQSNKINQLVKTIEAIENNIEENKKTIKNISADVFNLQRLKMDDLVNEFYQYKNQNDKVTKNLKNLIDEKITEFKNNLLDKNNYPNSQEQNTNNITSAINELQLKDMANELKNYISNNILETNKFFKKELENLNIPKITQDISIIQKELKEKITQKNLLPMDIKIEETQNNQIDLKSRISEAFQYLEYCKEHMSKIEKNIEYFSSQINNLNQNESQKDKKDNDLINGETIKLFVKKDSYEEDISKIFKKMEKIFILQQENSTKISSIEKKLKFFATDKDIKSIEHYTLNMIQEFKINSIKKFMDKKEGFKSLKLLGLQVKNINEYLNLNNNNISVEKLLMNNNSITSYICPSCDNKINNFNQNINQSFKEKKDSKNYRMGQGFSHMLNLIKSDLMKNAEKISDEVSIKVDENNNNINEKEKHNRSCLENKSLPRLNSQKSFNILNVESKNNYLDTSNNNISVHYNNDNNLKTLKNNSIDKIINMKSDIKRKIFKKIEKNSPWNNNRNQISFTKLKKVK